MNVPAPPDRLEILISIVARGASPVVTLLATATLALRSDPAPLVAFSALNSILGIMGVLVSAGGGVLVMRERGSKEVVADAAIVAVVGSALMGVVLAYVMALTTSVPFNAATAVLCVWVLFAEATRCNAFQLARYRGSARSSLLHMEATRVAWIWGAVLVSDASGHLFLALVGGLLGVQGVGSTAQAVRYIDPSATHAVQRLRYRARSVIFLGTSAAAGAALNLLEIPVVAALLSTEDARDYIVALRYASLAVLPFGVGLIYLGPALVRDPLSRLRSRIVTATRISLLSGLALGGGAALFVDRVVSGSELAPKWPLLGVLGAAALLNVTLGPSTLVLAIRGHERVLFAISVVNFAIYASLLIGSAAASKSVMLVALASAVGTIAFNLIAWRVAHSRTTIRTDIFASKRRIGLEPAVG